MKCLECKNLDLKHAPKMSRHGFGHCKQEGRSYVHVSVTWNRECGKFKAVDEATIGERSIWLAKQNGD